MTNIPDGWGFISGRSAETARAALDAADAAGYEASAVLTTHDGYLVPESVARAYEKALGAPDADPEVEKTPDESWKNDEIKTWAEEHDVDLGDATKKADMLAAIRTADTKEKE